MNFQFPSIKSLNFIESASRDMAKVLKVNFVQPFWNFIVLMPGPMSEDDLIPKSVEEYRKKEYWDWRYDQ